MVKGELCIGVFALREIQLGEEITIDYKFERYGEKPMRCFLRNRRVLRMDWRCESRERGGEVRQQFRRRRRGKDSLGGRNAVMLECDEDQIVKEEKEARVQHEQENGVDPSGALNRKS